MRPPITPIAPRQSQYGIDPSLVKTRVCELPGMTSVTLRELFPDLPAVIFPSDEGISAVRRHTEQALSNVDMSKIKPEHKVNILSSHHGFTLLGGEPYAEMLRTIRDVIEEKNRLQQYSSQSRRGVTFPRNRKVPSVAISLTSTSREKPGVSLLLTRRSPSKPKSEPFTASNASTTPIGSSMHTIATFAKCTSTGWWTGR